MREYTKKSFQYRKRYGLHAINMPLRKWRKFVRFQYRKRYGLHAIKIVWMGPDKSFVSIPQAVWIACNSRSSIIPIRPMAVSIPQAVWIACNGANLWDALGAGRVSIPQAVWIACNFTIQFRENTKARVSIPQAVWIACNCRPSCTVPDKSEFQYRKRYGLHAMIRPYLTINRITSFNTASGMDCMQFR